MVDNLQAGSTVNNFVIWHDGNDNGLLQKIKITGDIISNWEYDENRVVQIHTEVQNDSHTHKFVNITEKPTTLDGYGITGGTISGDLVVTNNLSAGTITETSARKYKENINTIDNSLDILQKLNGVHYDWKNTSKKDIGFIADDVLKVLPELVLLQNGEVEGMNYSKLTAVLVNGVKELTQRVQDLETIIKEGEL